ncbi:unnamed protein product, partial [Thlaspi arvense]
AILKRYVVGGSDTGNLEKFMAYIVPSLDELSKDMHDVNEDISYTWVGGDDANDRGTYLVSFDDGTASYLKSNTRSMCGTFYFSCQFLWALDVGLYKFQGWCFELQDEKVRGRRRKHEPKQDTNQYSDRNEDDYSE